jgi:tRNA A-37 threonylcarbamoyl transferase component Bud32
MEYFLIDDTSLDLGSSFSRAKTIILAALEADPTRLVCLDVRFVSDFSYIICNDVSHSPFNKCNDCISIVHLCFNEDLSFVFDFQASKDAYTLYKDFISFIFASYPLIRVLHDSNIDSLQALQIDNCMIQTGSKSKTTHLHRPQSMFHKIVNYICLDYIENKCPHNCCDELSHIVAEENALHEALHILKERMQSNNCLFPFRNEFQLHQSTGPFQFVYDVDENLNSAQRPISKNTPVTLSTNLKNMLKFRRLFMWQYISKYIIVMDYNSFWRPFTIPLPSSQSQNIWETKIVQDLTHSTIGSENDFKLTKQLGHTSSSNSMIPTKQCYFGVQCSKHNASNKYVFIKLEYLTNRENIRNEAKYLSKLQICRETFGIPELIWYGSHGFYEICITEQLGSTLDTISRQLGSFSLKTTIILAKQLIQSVAYLHHLGIVHRDIKPANMCMGPPSNSTKLYLIDFDLCSSIHSQSKNRVGTFDFMSINVHSHFSSYSFFDDMESIAYVLLYWMCGTLPWTHVNKSFVKQKYSKFNTRLLEKEICQMKRDLSAASLDQNIPIEFQTYMESIREKAECILTKTIPHTAKPDYVYIQKLMSAAAQRLNLDISRPQYDWELS